MPVYAYCCSACQHSFEVKRGFGEEADVASCPLCGGEARKQFCPVPTIYKGKGFYSTDHRPTNWDSPEKPAEKEPKAEAAKPEPKGS